MASRRLCMKPRVMRCSVIVSVPVSVPCDWGLLLLRRIYRVCLQDRLKLIVVEQFSSDSV